MRCRRRSSPRWLHGSSGEVPTNPGAWLTTTARRKAIDRLRRAANYARKQKELEYLVDLDAQGRDGIDDRTQEVVVDDQLKLDVHVLPSCAGSRCSGGADAQDARRPDDS